MPSIKDVALKAGVSVATVSRVFSHPAAVRPELRQKVLDVVEEMGYRPNRIASSLRKLQSQTIGVLVADIRNPYFTAITRVIEDLAHAKGMSVFLCNTDEDAAKEQHYLRTLMDEHVGGVILSPTQDSLISYEKFIKSETPLVMVDRRIERANVNCVVCDNIQSSYALTSHLIENGYKRIVAVLGVQNSSTGRERLQGYKMALMDHGLKFDPALVTFVPPREAETEAYLTRLLSSKHQPDAILSGNSRVTIGALNALRAAKLSVPHDIGLCGFDETAWTPHVGLGITVISQPTNEIGATAADLLFQTIEHGSRPTREVILKGQLIKRGSTLPRPR